MMIEMHGDGGSHYKVLVGIMVDDDGVQKMRMICDDDSDSDGSRDRGWAKGALAPTPTPAPSLWCHN